MCGPTHSPVVHTGLPHTTAGKIREIQADVGKSAQASLGNPGDPRVWEIAVTICRFGLEGHISPLTFGGPPVGAVIALPVSDVSCKEQHARIVRMV
jgi:hypothetical protein